MAAFLGHVCMLFAFAALEAVPIAVYLAVGRLEILISLVPIGIAVYMARQVIIKREIDDIRNNINFDIIDS